MYGSLTCRLENEDPYSPQNNPPPWNDPEMIPISLHVIHEMIPN